jgi:hypothetical protein
MSLWKHLTSHLKLPRSRGAGLLTQGKEPARCGSRSARGPRAPRRRRQQRSRPPEIRNRLRLLTRPRRSRKPFPGGRGPTRPPVFQDGARIARCYLSGERFPWLSIPKAFQALHALTGMKVSSARSTCEPRPAQEYLDAPPPFLVYLALFGLLGSSYENCVAVRPAVSAVR